MAAAMRVLLLCTDAYGGHGGIALYNRDLAEALASLEEIEEVIVVPRVMRTDATNVPAKITFVPDAAKGPAHYLRAIANAKRGRPDLVICGHVNLLPVACAIAPHPLLMIYGIDAWRPFPGVVARRVLHRAGAVVSISNITCERFLGWSGYRGPTHFLPNAIHAEQYALRPKKRDLVERYGLEGKWVLLTVGRLAPDERKGFDAVLEVLVNLPEDIVYIIAGGGDDSARLQQKAARLGIARRVIFTGLFPDDEKPDLYSVADAYIMPSRGEGFGFVFLEALASGAPAIGSKHDGGREALLDGKLGQLVDPLSRAEIEAAVRELYTLRPERRIPEALQCFAYEQFCSRLRAIIASTRA
jgi:glycosyltransferase involved in cell wall biosynthesis